MWSLLLSSALSITRLQIMLYAFFSLELNKLKGSVIEVAHIGAPQKELTKSARFSRATFFMLIHDECGQKELVIGDKKEK